jgi:hypothetical protein
LTRPRSQDGTLKRASAALSAGFRSLGSRPPRSGLERSDFVLWHICDMPRCLTRVRNALKTKHRRELHTAVFKEVKLNRGRAMGFASQDW